MYRNFPRPILRACTVATAHLPPTMKEEEPHTPAAILLALLLPGCEHPPPTYLLHPGRELVQGGPKRPPWKPYSAAFDGLAWCYPVGGHCGVAYTAMEDAAMVQEKTYKPVLEQFVESNTSIQLLGLVASLFLWDPDPQTDRYLRGRNLDKLLRLATLARKLPPADPANICIKKGCCSIMGVYRTRPAGTAISGLDAKLAELFSYMLNAERAVERATLAADMAAQPVVVAVTIVAKRGGEESEGIEDVDYVAPARKRPALPVNRALCF